MYKTKRNHLETHIIRLKKHEQPIIIVAGNKINLSHFYLFKWTNYQVRYEHIIFSRSYFQNCSRVMRDVSNYLLEQQ